MVNNMFKQCSISSKGHKVCQQIIPPTIKPPSPAWTTRHDGAVDADCLEEILTLPFECHCRNGESSDRATLLIVSFCWACENCSFSVPFLADSLLQGWMRCAVRDALLHTSVWVTVACFPLTTDINKAFLLDVLSLFFSAGQTSYPPSKLREQAGRPYLWEVDRERRRLLLFM